MRPIHTPFGGWSQDARCVEMRGGTHTRDELWSSSGFENLYQALPSPTHTQQKPTLLLPHTQRNDSRCTFAARSLSRCGSILLALCLFLLAFHPRLVRASVTASLTKGWRWHIGLTTGVDALVLCIEVSWFSALVNHSACWLWQHVPVQEVLPPGTHCNSHAARWQVGALGKQLL